MQKILLIVLVGLIVFAVGCRRQNTEFVTVALPESFSTFDTLTSTASDAAAERVRNLMFNSLVKKNESFEYVGELASDIKVSDDGKTITFTLRDGVKFHNGNPFTSADVKYTFDKLFASKGYKSGAFFDTVPVTGTTPSSAAQPASNSNADVTNADTQNGASREEKKKQEEPQTRQEAHIVSFETPDAKTVVITVGRPALKNQLLSNLVAIPIIADGTADQQKDSPVDPGPFKFVRFDASQNTVDLEAFADYFEGAPKIAKLRIKTVTDASALQAELQTGGVDLAPVPTNLPPDTMNILRGMENLKVEQFDGSNIQYIGLNTDSPPLNKVKVRQAIGYAVDKDKVIRELLSGPSEGRGFSIAAHVMGVLAGNRL